MIDKKTVEKPIELKMDELRNKIINNCIESELNLFFINLVLEGVYKEIQAQYMNDANNRIQEYNKFIETNKDEAQKEGE
ncbi:MAG: hypothetical protein K1W28_09300 [Lachnospiraceae bacterium]